VDNNKFINLDSSNIIFAINYESKYIGKRTYSMQNNVFKNSTINTQFISLQSSEDMNVIIANNVYENITILSDQKIFYF